jgi:hypothetical protein
MSWATSFAIMIWIVLSAAPSSAQGDRGKPQFSFAEEVIIARNDALGELLPLDPQGVRRILDALAPKQQDAPPPGSAPTGRQLDVLGEPALPDGVDAASNPDLKLLFQRSSPEAAYDLFQILKRVGRSAAK